MRTIIVSRTTGNDNGPRPVYQVRYQDDGTVSMFWYGADDELAPFNPQPTPAEANEYIERARTAPDGQITTLPNAD